MYIIKVTLCYQNSVLYTLGAIYTCKLQERITHFAESIEGTVEEHKHCSTCHFRDVVERLTGIVAYPCIWVIKTG